MYEEEMSWIYDKEDLVSLRPGREHAWLDGMLERLLKVCRCRLVRVMNTFLSDHIDSTTNMTSQYIFCTPVGSSWHPFSMLVQSHQ